jgi:hypothetical protein
MGADIVGFIGCPLQNSLGIDGFLGKLKLRAFKRQIEASIPAHQRTQVRIQVQGTNRASQTLNYEGILRELGNFESGIPECANCPLSGGRPVGCYRFIKYPIDSIGLMVQLLTPWSRFPAEFNYLEYDGNKSTVTPSFWVELLKNKPCPHHPLDETGDPFFDIREHSILWSPGTSSEAVPLSTTKTSWMRALLDQISFWLRGHRF